MKTKFALADAELLALQVPGLAATAAHKIWQDVCNRLRCQFSTLEDAKTGDPREFLAEPIPEPAVNEEVLKTATPARNAFEDKLCPGRHLAQRDLPDPAVTEIEFTAQRILYALANGGLMSTMKPPLSAAERDIFDKCRNIEKKVVGQFFGDSPQEYRVFRQEVLWLPNSGKPGFIAHGGKPEVVFRVGTKALIGQYKVTPGDVADNSTNAELLDLAVLVAGHYGPLEQVATVVIQPHVAQAPEVVLYALADLEEAYKCMVVRITLSNHPGAVRTPGEIQCKSCKAVGSCNENRVWRAAQQPVVSQTTSEFDPVTLTRRAKTENQEAVLKPAEQTPVLEAPVYPPKRAMAGKVGK